MVTYYSKAWLEECADHLNNSERHLKKAKKLNGKFAFRVWDGPDGKDRYATWEFEDGKCIATTFGCRTAPWDELRDAPYDDNWIVRFSCPYDMMAKLNKGEMSPLKALGSPEYKVEGKKTELFKKLQAVNSWNEHNAEVQCNYVFTQTDDDGNEI
ncbi:MAG: hypothetical protein JXA49_08100 [Actinobacteria bacterium]|nr:hypothetical protein [Actinomycetota bacterium]